MNPSSAHCRTWLCMPAVPSVMPCMILSTLSDDKAERADVRPRQYLADAIEGAVSQPLGVTDCLRRYTLVHPESAPQRRFPVGSVDARREIERRLSCEDCLPGHGRDGRHPGEHGAFAKAQARPLVRENVSEHDPLIESEPVRDDERYLVFGTMLDPSCEVARHVVNHHRRVRRLVVEARIAAHGPCEKGPIHFHLQFGDPRARL